MLSKRGGKLLKKFVALVLSILIATMSISATIAGSDLVSRTVSTDTYQNEDETYTKILYSGIRNVFEDGIWKRAEDARSLKGKGFEVVYLEKDPELIRLNL